MTKTDRKISITNIKFKINACKIYLKKNLML